MRTTGSGIPAVVVMLAWRYSEPPSFRTEPSLVAIPNPAAPLAAALSFCPALIDVADGVHMWRLEYGPEFDSSEVELAVVGTRSDTRHEISVDLRSGRGCRGRASRRLCVPHASPAGGRDRVPEDPRPSQRAGRDRTGGDGFQPTTTSDGLWPGRV